MKLQILEQIYELEFTVNAVCDLEELTGKLLGEVLSQGGYKSVRALLWCGLTENMPQLTMKQAGALMHEYLKGNSLEQLTVVLGEAIEQAGFLRARGLVK